MIRPSRYTDGQHINRWTAEAVSMISRGELPPLLLGDGS